ncbi:phospho-N-acetylmuramoyl-pentapeptide-transferase [Treponema zioleckii]|uniref:phospho-N-acetylmuramoyl-pentapeptide- transferase n=1 Tax=Treponema zioleckii TaxID=331680 RepID=UPI00168AD784|nr:phospho-N-acetylmuramoyl-pentapeptide-transferase [Treponema zioleckii]
MLYYLGGLLTQYFGPARLLQSYAVLIVLALYFGFLFVRYTLPLFYDHLPHDRGREFTVNAEAAKGKPTGSGVVWVSAFVVISLIFVPIDWVKCSVLVLTWIMMLTGYLDDHSINSWGEYRKALLDLFISIAAAVLIAIYLMNIDDGKIYFWFPFFTKKVAVAPWLFVTIAVVLLWASVNTTNCTDGVDGLSSTLVLVALITLGIVFYFILGHKDIAAYLLVPNIEDGAAWAVMTFALAGVLMGYLWHNAYPSHVLMGDAGSRALGFYIGVCVLITRNPFMIFATSTVIFINGGMGLLKVFLKRFFHISILSNIRFPLHDHMRKNHGWSPTQVLVKFLILQILVTVAIVGVIFKIR